VHRRDPAIAEQPHSAASTRFALDGHAGLAQIGEITLHGSETRADLACDVGDGKAVSARKQLPNARDPADLAHDQWCHAMTWLEIEWRV